MNLHGPFVFITFPIFIFFLFFSPCIALLRFAWALIKVYIYYGSQMAT